LQIQKNKNLYYYQRIDRRADVGATNRPPAASWFFIVIAAAAGI